MNDDAIDADRAQREAVALKISAELQRRLWAVVNDPDTPWGHAPHCVAHGAAEFFGNVLAALIETNPADLAFDLFLIDQVQQRLITRAGALPPKAH